MKKTTQKVSTTKEETSIEINENTIPDADFFSKRGVDLFNESKFAEAIQDFDRAIKLDEENPYFFNLRGHAKYSAGDLKGARTDFNKSKKLKTKGKKVKKSPPSAASI